MCVNQRISRWKLCVLSSFLLALFSCHKNEVGSLAELSINKTAILVDTSIGTIDSFTVHSTVPWKASLSPGGSWLHIDKNSGGAGNTAVKLTVVSNGANVLTETATITIAAMNSGNIPSVILTVTKRSLHFNLAYLKDFGGTGEESALRSIVRTPEGGTIIVGTAASNDGDVHGNHGTTDVWLVKLNAGGDTVWTKTFGGTAEDRGSSIAIIPNGGYIICGSTASTNGYIHHNHGGTDAWLLKLDTNGDTVWTKTFGGTGNDRANSIIATPDGGFAVAGATESNDGDIHQNHGGTDVWVLKLNTAGDSVWTKTFGGSQWDEAIGIITIPGGGYALSGLTNSNDQDVTGFHTTTFFSFDMWIVRLDGSGNKMWAKTLGGTGNELALSMINVPDGFAIAGLTSSNDGDVTGLHGTVAFFNDMWIVKLDNNGSIAWAKTYGGSMDDEGESIVAAPDGGYVVAGATASKDGDVSGYHDGQGTDDIWIVKLNAAGLREWTKTIGGSNDDVGGAIIPTEGGYIISGFTNSDDGDFLGSGHHGNEDIFALKLSVP